MPPALVEPCIKAGSPAGGLVLDPFSGAGTVGLVAMRLGRSFVGCELNSAYAEIARSRLFEDAPLYNVVETAAAPGRAEAGEAE
jgi:site-specific DNA-methyltransferase (adenine-specific)